MVSPTKLAAASLAITGANAFSPNQPSKGAGLKLGNPQQDSSTALNARQNTVGWGADPELQRLGASTTVPLDQSALKKGKGAESQKLTRESPQQAFGFKQKSIFSGNSSSQASFNTALSRSAEKNGLAIISTKDWSAAEHFQSLSDFGGTDYVSKVASTPEDRFVGQGNGIAELYDDGKPTITQAIVAHVFEGSGQEFQGNAVVLNDRGAPLDTKVFAGLYEKAATAVEQSGTGDVSAVAKAAIAELQDYVVNGSMAVGPSEMKEALVDKSLLFEGWSKMKNEGYSDNLDQAMLTFAHEFNKLDVGDALVGILECPKAYGNISHMLSVVLKKESADSGPEIHIAHHESAEQYAGKDADWSDGKMNRVAGVPLDTDKSDAAYGEGMVPKSRNRMPVINSLKFGGTPNTNLLVSKNPDAIVDRLATEVLEAQQGEPKPYSPRDTDGEVGNANTCIAYTARLLAHEDGELRTTDGKEIDVSGITARSAPEVVQQMGSAGLLAVGPTMDAAFIVTPAGIFQNKEPSAAQDAALLEGTTGLELFSALGPAWGVGQFKPDMDTPANGPLPHHLGVFIGKETLKDLN